jgi:hypothetical protein
MGSIIEPKEEPSRLAVATTPLISSASFPESPLSSPSALRYSSWNQASFSSGSWERAELRDLA